VSKNRILRRIFGPKGDEMVGSLRKLRYEELRNLYISPSIIIMIKSRTMKLTGHIARMGEGRNAYMISVGTPGGRRPLGRPTHRWEDNIKMDPGEIGWGNLD
jgi:hypothetical protein